jgi:hypothetical protein
MAGGGPAPRNLAVFHDHEGFTTLWGSKSFAIMKFRSGVRIAAADRGIRAGNAGSAGAGVAVDREPRSPGWALPVFRRPSLP